jgi:hypothetical protein
MRRRRAAALASLALLAGAGAARSDTVHFYSYDPGDEATRDAAGPVTLQLRKGLLHTSIVAVRSTEAKASVDLTPAPAAELGRAGLAGVKGVGPAERDLYQVGTADEGAALISALCPGAKRAWMAIGKVRVNADLHMDVIGESPGEAPRLCRALAYSFHGEWRAPPGGPLLRERDLPHGRFPGT